MNFCFRLMIIVGMVGIFKCTVDLNFKELQYIAGKLKKHECQKLSESLHNKKLYSAKPQHFTGKHEPNKTCLFLLMKYDRTEGKGKTFLELEVRLREIGRPDLADKLSKQVYHEKTLALKRNFLDDPYRKMIHEKSFLLDQEEKKQEKIVIEDKPYKFNWETFWICSSVFSIVLLILCVCRIRCPQLGKSLTKKFCSNGTIDTCNFCDEECSRCWKKFKLNYSKYVTGLDVDVNVDDEEQLMREAGLLDDVDNDKTPLTVHLDQKFSRRSGQIQVI